MRPLRRRSNALALRRTIGRDCRILETVKRVAQVDQPPGEAERLELALPQGGDEGNLGGHQLGDQPRRPERRQERLVHRAEVDERPLASQRPAIVWGSVGSAAEKL